MLLDEVFDLLFGDFTLVGDYVGAAKFIARTRWIGDSYHGCIQDQVVEEEEGFDLRGRDLETFVFDEFLISN